MAMQFGDSFLFFVYNAVIIAEYMPEEELFETLSIRQGEVRNLQAVLGMNTDEIYCSPWASQLPFLGLQE